MGIRSNNLNPTRFMIRETSDVAGQCHGKLVIGMLQ